MPGKTCFSKDELRRYLLGELPDDTSDAVAVHVEECSDCESTIVSLDRDSDTLISAIRGPVNAELPPSAYRLAAARAKAGFRKTTDDSSGDWLGEATGPPRLRDYEIQSPLARGGMGTVYRARHCRLNRIVALKVLPNRWLKDPVVVARFEREMQAVGSLKHPAIVQATDGGEVDGIHFLVMELIEGMDCGSLVNLVGSLKYQDACEIVRRAAEGMDYAHSQGVVHRDLKPSNLMLTKDGDVKVLDLGLARLADEQLGGDELTTVGQLMGTLDYMSPEQLENSHEVDERSDLYSLGATLYKLLSGHSPHHFESGEPLVSKLRRISTDPIKPLAESDPDVPGALCELVDRLLSRDPEERPGSMRQLMEALKDHISGSDLKALAKAAGKAARKREREQSQTGIGSGAELDFSFSQSQATKSPRSPIKMLFAIAASLLIPIAIFGLLITIQTAAGTLVIETASPDVEVRILKAGDPYQELTLTQKPRLLKLGAGEYEIEIVSDADGLIVENGRFQLKRGETWLAKVVHQKPSTAGKISNAMSEVAADSPTYDGKTLDEWLGLLRRERSTKQVYEACQAIRKLDADDDRPVVEALIHAARFHSSGDAYRLGDRATARIHDSIERVLVTRDQTLVVAELTKELKEGNKNGRNFALSYVTDRHESMKQTRSAELLSALEELIEVGEKGDRYLALRAYSFVAPEQSVRSKMGEAIDDENPEVLLFAAGNLIQYGIKKELVVDRLKRLVANGEAILEWRTQAAVQLGSLGKDARDALDELVARVKDESYEVSVAATYRDANGTVSLKDAAIKSLGLIGDQSVVPTLVLEWERRAFHRDAPRKSDNSMQRYSRANSYGSEWVAEAIGQLTGMEPSVARRSNSTAVTVWSIKGWAFSNFFRAAMRGDRKPPADPLTSAKKLSKYALDDEFTEAYEMIKKVDRLPSKEQLDRELEMIEFLASEGNAGSVLRAIYVRRSASLELREDRKKLPRSEVIAAYQSMANQILRENTSLSNNYQPLLLQLVAERYPGAAVSFLQLIDQFEKEDQLDGVVKIFKMINGLGREVLLDGIEPLSKWLKQPENRDALDELLRTGRSQAWLDLVIGILIYDAKDAKTLQIVKERFHKDDIQRVDLVLELTGRQTAQPDLATLIVDLLKDPSLEVGTSALVQIRGRPEEQTLRAEFMNLSLIRIVDDQRPRFIPYLRDLVKTGSPADAYAAERLLDSWK